MLATIESWEESILERQRKITAVLYRRGHAVSQVHSIAIAAANWPLWSSPFHVQKGDDILMRLASFQREKSPHHNSPQYIPEIFSLNNFVTFFTLNQS